MSQDAELLVGLSNDELEALAEGMLASVLQAHMDELIARRKGQKLSAHEAAELDRLLMRADQLTLIKTRARYTLRQERTGVVAGQAETEQ